ncbi:hypothetical protein NE237_024340 [Protea cynaroides]|uniref:Cyclin-dependent kinase inhibitor domain-containing protein n=1 Tax=Protea cynaroides TaxID=273540 RepID=A0A9Q0HD48_9MAGN|nr:hypothetical protein NE237_024340 [Protea cynaroides]
MAGVSSFNPLPCKTLFVNTTKCDLGFRMKNSLSIVIDDFVGILSGKGREVARLRFPIGGENPGVRPLLRIQATGVAVDDDERGSEKEEWIGEGVATVLGEEEEKIREPSGFHQSRHCRDGMTLGMERNCLFAGLGSEPMKLSQTSLESQDMYGFTFRKLNFAHCPNFHKHNFDILKNVPLEERYEWVRVKP